MSDKHNERRSLAAMLRGYAPRPSQEFYTRMAHTPWLRKESRMNAHWSIVRPRLTAVLAAIIIVALAIALATPAVRASLSSWLGLGISPSDIVTPPGAKPSELVSSTTLDTISKQAGWTIVAPAWLPEGYRFGQANYDTRNSLVYLSFLATRQLPGGDPSLTQTKSLSLVQARQNNVIPLQVAPTTSVQDVTVNGQPGAYAVGAWKSEFVPKAGEANGGHFESQWRNDLQVQNVFWQVGTVYLVLVSDDPAVSRQDLLKTADSVK